MRKKKIIEASAAKPFIISEASTPDSPTRRNIAGTIERTDRFKNIENGLIPFKSATIYGSNRSSVEVRDAVILCQKCYYNFAIFRNIIDLMTEFSVSELFFRDGSELSRDFFNALFNKINLWELQDKFYREYYRSGNVFIYRYDTEIQPSDIKKITQVYGAEFDPKNADNPMNPNNSPDDGTNSDDIDTRLNVDTFKIPSRYIILNPADIQMTGTANFSYGMYHKTLTEYEIAQLKNPKTEEDVEVFNALPLDAQKQVKAGGRAITIPLDPDKITMVFYKKQDYEPFAVPMGFPVLEDINFKAELKKIDMAIARTMQQILLLVTNGAEPDKGGINKENLKAFTSLLSNPSVGRVLVADYTTEAKFVVPDIGELLNPQKYEIVERDINIGLNNIFAGEEKFANQAQKVEVFVARLEQGRKAFLHSFLIPEIKRIAKSIKLKNYPTPLFEDIKLKDNTDFAKIFARLIEIGILTPEQGLRAIESNSLPDPTVMVQEQKAYKAQRDSGLYEPLVGGPKDAQDAGRPDGSTGPKKVTPIGASIAYSLVKVKDNLILAQEVEAEVIAALKTKHNIRRISNAQKEVAQQITHLIITNEEPPKWKDCVASYIENPEDKNKTRVLEVLDLAATHDIDAYLAGILLASKKNEQTV